EGFVIISPEALTIPQLETAYRQLGSGKVAVRSSAIGEDGTENSFAGQYETLLSIIGTEPLFDAVQQCVASIQTSRAEAYQEHANLHETSMCVVVQKMVDAASAGVLFTADPVSGRRDILIIDAVQGLGDRLVSGEATPDHYEIDTSGKVIFSDTTVESAGLEEQQILKLASEARLIALEQHKPLDLEWAIDKQGNIYWLQARPITTLPADLNEFDTPVNEDDILTTCNIAEMMPGAVCPLSLSITLRGIEHGFQHMDVLMGAMKSLSPEFTQVSSFYGHWFINLSGKVAGSGHVMGMNADEAGFSICGQRLPDLIGPPKQSLFTRLRGGWRFFRYLSQADPVIDAFQAKLDAFFKVQLLNNPSEMIAHIDDLALWVLEVEEIHVRSSSTSAVAGGILQGMITRGKDPTQEQMGEIALLMSGASGVESALLVEELEQIARLIASDTDTLKTFRTLDLTDAHLWLKTQAPESVRDAFTNFLSRHGHRGYRELCVREQGWGENPLPLIQTLQANVMSKELQTAPAKKRTPIKTAKLPAHVKWLLPKVHNGIRRRERTKSLLTYITREIGKAYRHLGHLLTNIGIFPDDDLVYFFTHEELLACKGLPEPAAVEHAIERRKAMDYQNRLEFSEICRGKPVPLVHKTVSNKEGLLFGRPVSHGVVEGICRVARTPSEATGLQAGEILIAPITDVAWTPYFSLIAGLATDIGSSVSHGAVIAREYGLPAVVNLKEATMRFRSGDRARLDGNNGSLEKI
ncbi:MAG: hypothetical protein KDI30_01010, partial [Pseudomonadales bacterium]|nr:hypothetical protein [Pseudomonadales bacterium]